MLAYHSVNKNTLKVARYRYIIIYFVSDILKHWVDSVLTYIEDTEDIMPMIMFAATHRDQCKVDYQILLMLISILATRHVSHMEGDMFNISKNLISTPVSHICSFQCCVLSVCFRLMRLNIPQISFSIANNFKFVVQFKPHF